ncbi:hypothetical protein MSG28_015991 [Choristoneura fumiferana]|uniref:Uncharacterized protein n=1 Tax=Choristoneura fumiferana TaxID=7141 RepID=A0ACC0K517_CHOFU|nr:hypothetical protein MSG28_015991 [Choristoneura fumiferana]
MTIGPLLLARAEAPTDFRLVEIIFMIIFITPDKTTCAECTCFPKEDPYVKNKKLNPCLQSPLTLYEYAAAVVDRLKYPDAYKWAEAQVAQWVGDVVGLPEYKSDVVSVVYPTFDSCNDDENAGSCVPVSVSSGSRASRAAARSARVAAAAESRCSEDESIIDNKINGRRLLMLEDPSHLPAIGIKNFEHIQKITSKVRQLFATDFVKFSRSIGLPPRKPLTHCTWFKSRTGPNWGIHVNWSRCDVLRWMKILMPEPSNMNHWDLVWYHKPEFPKVKFARVKKREEKQRVPIYKAPKEEICRECLVTIILFGEPVPRKFKFEKCIPDDQQFIWIERPRPPSPVKEKKAAKKKVRVKPRETRVFPKPVTAEGLAGKQLLLARRKMPKPKFYPEK